MARQKKRVLLNGRDPLQINKPFVHMSIGLWLLNGKAPGDDSSRSHSEEGFPFVAVKQQGLFDFNLYSPVSMTGKWLSCETKTFGITLCRTTLHYHTTIFRNKCLKIMKCFILPFFGRPLPLPSRDFLSSSLLLGLVGATVVPLTASPLSLRESPLPESLEEFFLSLRLAFALRRASWILLLDEDTQLPLISLLMFLLVITDPPLSSSPDAKESLRSSASFSQQEEK